MNSSIARVLTAASNNWSSRENTKTLINFHNEMSSLQ